MIIIKKLFVTAPILHIWFLMVIVVLERVALVFFK